MKHTIIKKTLAATLAMTLFTGCVDGIEESTSYSSSSVGTKNDTLSIVKTITPKGFIVFWTKNAGSYGEVIYTDNLSKERGNGYPLTSNSTGVMTMPCTMVSSDSSGAKFSCEPSNVSYTKSIYLQTGVQYKWLVNYGFDHEKGEVEAVMTYQGDGSITVE